MIAHADDRLILGGIRKGGPALRLLGPGRSARLAAPVGGMVLVALVRTGAAPVRKAGLQVCGQVPIAPWRRFRIFMRDVLIGTRQMIERRGVEPIDFVGDQFLNSVDMFLVRPCDNRKCRARLAGAAGAADAMDIVFGWAGASKLKT